MTQPDRLTELTELLRAFNADRQWEQFHSPKNLAMSLASEVGELVAHFRWRTPEQCERDALDDTSLARVGEEVGDSILVLLTLCQRLRLDPIAVAREKLELNAVKYPVELTRGNAEKPLTQT